jgi:hypothetical protein
MGQTGPTGQSKNRRLILLEKLKDGATRRGACGASRVSKTQFYQWLKDDAGFKANVQACEAQAEQYWVDELAACARQARGDPKYQGSLIFMMKARFGFRDHGFDPNAAIEDDGSNEFAYQTVDGEVEGAEA